MLADADTSGMLSISLLLSFIPPPLPLKQRNPHHKRYKVIQPFITLSLQVRIYETTFKTTFFHKKKIYIFFASKAFSAHFRNTYSLSIVRYLQPYKLMVGMSQARRSWILIVNKTYTARSPFSTFISLHSIFTSYSLLRPFWYSGIYIYFCFF